ncbi:MAG: aminodeoxychorismate/anthranilate synthase component II [Chitinophagaceae bacterium]|nr:MAG: aminodeoxychorismate/anthranilate synthase component II [Chitinophagaceae bacterium]
MKILVFDNYDSFTYNLVHLVRTLTDAPLEVHRNDAIPLEKVAEFDKIILSPGPGIPSEAGMLLPLVKEYAATKSILGVCLGHQAIGEAFGAKLVNLASVFHGMATPVNVGNRESGIGKRSNLFDGLPETIEVGRYHSWVVGNDNFPAELEVLARDEEGYIMALQHKTYDLQGVQFHPESILTPQGSIIMKNWLKE